ncbi:unnamed protein product, partial [Acanthoscelides obtectus]
VNRKHVFRVTSYVYLPVTLFTDLAGKSCKAGEYMYDTCTFCQCDPYTKKFYCIAGDCHFSRGTCNESENEIEGCNECHCTFTRFRLCEPIDECTERKGKPGTCPIVYTTFPNIVQNLCINQKIQDCYTDYGCPGKKKCCKMANCSLGCADPV